MDGESDLLADSHSILNRWKNHCCHLLNINDVRQTEIHAGDPLESEPGALRLLR
jgi:hypothetical protein